MGQVSDDRWATIVNSMSIQTPQQTIVTDPLLSTQEFAKLASIKCRTLERWRLLDSAAMERGQPVQGPRFIRVGGKRLVRYRVSECDRWISQAAA